MSGGHRWFARIAAWLGRLGDNTRGNVAIIFALSSTALVIGAGAGVDLSRAYYARQKLSQVATLTCQFATRPSAVNAGAAVTYAYSVNQFASNALASQKWPANGMPTGGPTGSSSTYFTATSASASSTIQEPTGVAELWYNVPTSFLQIIHVNQIRVHAVLNCQPPANPNDQPNPTNPNTQPPAGTILAQEGFETGASGYYFTLPNGSIGTQPTASQTFPATAGYQGDHGNQFFIMGFCLEIDAAGVISASDPEGNHSAELDCDNGHGGAGNSSISTKSYMAPGYYELRYFFRSRILYNNYYPTYICGSTASDLSWANDGSFSNGQRTNQINVYLDASSSNGTTPPPTHTTIDGTQQLAGSNLIDMCVDSFSWIERSIKIKITTAGYYWLSFAADGNNDSVGGQIDNIRLCVEQCPDSLQDNFPAAWLAANNGGVNKVLFEDSFESPTYPATTGNYLSNKGNLFNSPGTTATSTCSDGFGTYASPPGWLCQYATGWAAAPYNQINFFLQGAAQGSQYIALDGDNSYSTGSASTNRLISRKFLLDPGYYSVSYNYTSGVNFSLGGTSFCFATPGSGYIWSSSYVAQAGHIRFSNTAYNADATTNIIGVFMSHGQLVSTPNYNNSLGSTTTYTNPDGTTSTTPTIAPDGVNWQNYNAAAVNPVIDTCGYSDNFAWLTRTVSIKITKPAYYWLTFSATNDVADGVGPDIDDVKLTALGSLYMSNPPTLTLVTIPVPAPQPTTNYTNSGAFNGFYIVADPLKPPAADQ